jgi:acetyl-CoA carboxylase beta subunit
MVICPDCKIEMDCIDNPNSRDYFEGEWYKCLKCGKMIFLDYDEMR